MGDATDNHHTETRDRGRDAAKPSAIPAAGWRDVLMRVKDEIGRDNVSLIAAGLGLFALLAAFPALAASLSLYGLFASPEQIASQIQTFADALPEQAASILQGRLSNLAESSGGALGLGAVVGFVLALWSARKGMVALMAACDVAYDEVDERGMLRKILESLGFTLAAVVGFVVVLALAVAAPVFFQAIGLGGAFQGVLAVLRWVLLWLFVVGGLALAYRYTPDRRPPQFRWVTWGAAIAATLWIAGSLLFALYVRNFGSYGETYGTLGGVVVLLLWFYLSGFVVVLGAEINAELEHQTGRDTTKGDERPRGRRGAYVADTVGEPR